jgi:peroxiredoxin Q/BCP
MAIQEGKKAPPFRLRSATGELVSLADFAGKDLVIYFYPRDNTPGCTAEAQGFREQWKKLQRRGVAVVGVSPDGPESHADFAACHHLPFPLLSDADHRMMTAYGAYGEKMMYGRRTKGVIRSTVWIGPDGVVVKHWPRVAKAADHPAQVLAAIAG